MVTDRATIYRKGVQNVAKARRLVEILLTLQTRRRFTAAELASELGVNRRTALRYLHELSEAGVPLASRPGPAGGYLVVRDGILPPLSFTVDQAVSLFFAYQALRDYGSLPFDADVESALQKLYQHMPAEARRRVDRMAERIEFGALHTDVVTPHLAALLDAALDQQVITIVYHGRDGLSERPIQPIGVYAQNGLWYCPAYCFTRKAVRVFRVDRVRGLKNGPCPYTPDADIAELTLKSYQAHISREAPTVWVEVALTPEGVRQLAHSAQIEPDDNGGGILRTEVDVGDLPFFAPRYLSMGKDAQVLAPEALLREIRGLVAAQWAQYGLPGPERQAVPETIR